MKSLHKIFIYCYIFFLFSFNTLASDIVKITGSSKQIIDNYLKLHQAFRAEMCNLGDIEKFQELYKNYSGEGFFLPLTEADQINFGALEDSLPDLNLKIEWIKNAIKTVNAYETLPDYSNELKEMTQSIEKLLKIKEMIDKEKGNKKDLIKKNRLEFNKLQESFNSLISKIPYYLNYKFPVNFLDLRKEYEVYKSSNKAKFPRFAQKIYTLRRVIEDGAPINSGDGTKPATDIYFRAILNTVALQVQKEWNTLPENLRYDLKFIIKKLENLRDENQGNKNKELSKLENWLNKSEQHLNFYKKIIALKDITKDGDNNLKEMVGKIVQANHELKNFVFDKQKKVYNFWIKNSDINQILFVIDTILYNEVGTVDENIGLERRAVTQIILNRFHEKSFTQIIHSDPWLDFVSELKKNGGKEYPWLNLLFKQGEFSFTYFYIPANVNIFCPEIDKRANDLRMENLEIALDVLKKPINKFQALRYYSRVSMLGRIEMSSIWKDYEEISESPGIKIKDITKLKKSFLSNEYNYLYSFKNRDNLTFEVLEIDKKQYVRPQYKDGTLHFYTYRNPHLFKYFKKKS